mgnify:CR=1 FL=1|tara:strand:- start:2303 stop:3277 length:975 start_codon:yes stop_codon:yes gene_type:complete
MASTSNVTSLYEAIVADLVPFYDNFVLLPNQQLIAHAYNITGGTGNTMNIPVTNAWTTGATITPGAAIVDLAGDGQADPVNDFAPTSVSLGVNKRGTGTIITTEDLEDGGESTVRNGIVTRLSRSIAQSTDKAGFQVMGHNSETAMTNLTDVDVVGMDGLLAASDKGTCELSYVFSDQALGYAVRREPTVQMFDNINHDRVEFTATLRNGFAQIQPTYIRAIASQEGIGSANAATLAYFAKSVANLKLANAPTDFSGFYAGVISPAVEYALSSELNGVGGTATGSIGSVAQGLANDALLQGMITQALGISFIRSNNLPSGLASA